MQIKQVPQDFLVTEIPAEITFGNGGYSYFEMQKEGLTTAKAAKIVATKLGIRLSDVGFAGAKDRKAITKQRISVRKNFQKDLEIGSNIILKYLGNSDKPLSLGEHEGNSFEIVARDLGLMECKLIETNAIFLEKLDFLLPNYFDEQRFSVQNIDIGILFLKKNYSLAIEMLKHQDEFFLVEAYLQKYPHDFVGAIRQIPRRQLMLFVHSVQSHLFNELSAGYVRRLKVEFREVRYSRGSFLFPIQKVEPTKLPLPGFGTEMDDWLKEYVDAHMKEHGVREQDYINRSIPDLSLEGSERDFLMKISDFKMTAFKEDELNKGKMKCRFSFSLQKGSYATIVIKFLGSH